MTALPAPAAAVPTGGLSLPAAAAAPHALGRSAVRSSRSREYSAALSALWASRGSSATAMGVGVGGGVGAPFDLLGKWLEVATSARVAALEGASTKLGNCWKLVHRMAAAARPLIDANAQATTDGDNQLRLAMLQGTVAHLGLQQLELLRVQIAEHAEAAMRGGMVGTEHDAAAKVTLSSSPIAPATGGGAGAGGLVSLDGGKSTPLWPTVYWCLRCGDLSAATRVMTRAASQQVATPGSWSALLALASVLDAATPPAGGAAAAAPSTGAIAQRIADARAEYWANGAPADRSLAVVYSVLCAPEPQAKLEDLMPGLEMSIEDWLWHRLCMVQTQLRETSGAGGAAGVSVGAVAAAAAQQPLAALQSLLYERLGEAHFNKARASPLLFFTVLLHSLQLERALAFLYAYPDYADEAVHLALALHHAGVLSITSSPSAATDGLVLYQAGGAASRPLLCLPNMLQHHVASWAQEDGVTALQYIFLLRGPPAQTEQLAVDSLLNASVSDVLLTRLAFLPWSTQARLMASVATRLHTERGMSTQAARMLFECQAYAPLASLLLDLLSAAILASPSANPTRALAPYGAPPASADEAGDEARATQLRSDAAAFLSEWRAADAAAAASQGAPLQMLLSIADLLYTAVEWRRQRASSGGEAALTAVLARVDALPLLPSTPVQVDAAQGNFRLAPPQLQRLAPPLLLTAMEATHAKFTSLRRTGGASHGAMAGAAAGGAAFGADAELRTMRERAEALVAFGGLSVWRTADAMGHAQMPAAASQQLASWLSEMA